MVKIGKLTGNHHLCIWVVRTMQISAGIDGFSRGFMTDGIASSGSILDFLLLNETALECSDTLLTWVWTWIGFNNI